MGERRIFLPSEARTRRDRRCEILLYIRDIPRLAGISWDGLECAFAKAAATFRARNRTRCQGHLAR